MNLEIVTAAQEIEPLLRAAARRGQGPRTLFKRALRAQQNKLSYQDWFLLLISLQALAPSPATAPRVRTECTQGSLPAAHGQGAPR